MDVKRPLLRRVHSDGPAHGHQAWVWSPCPSILARQASDRTARRVAPPDLSGQSEGLLHRTPGASSRSAFSGQRSDLATRGRHGPRGDEAAHYTGADFPTHSAGAQSLFPSPVVADLFPHPERESVLYGGRWVPMVAETPAVCLTCPCGVFGRHAFPRSSGDRRTGAQARSPCL